MSGDGPCEREADAQEQSWLDDERLSLDEQLADESRDDLLDIAHARMTSFFLDKVL